MKILVLGRSGRWKKDGVCRCVSRPFVWWGQRHCRAGYGVVVVVGLKEAG